MIRKLSLLVALIGALLGAGACRAAAFPAKQTITDAQHRWQAVVFYRFSATLEQEQVPAATLTNVGRSLR